MPSTPRSLTWPIEPHTLAKHEILKRYLGAWFPIILSKFPKAIYVDGFCGPGKYDDGEDGSPIIALREALKYSEKTSSAIDFYFFDKNEDRIEHLKSILSSFKTPPKFKIFVKTGEFSELMKHLHASLPDAPMFVFIDPFGWSDIPLDIVQLILSRRSAEVLINFMSSYVARFLDHPNEKTTGHFINLFGSPHVLSIPSSPKRIDELRLLYQRQLTGSAQFVKYFQMQNDKNRPIYDLFFASNSQRGYVKMKEAFWKVDPTGSFSFSDATNPNQLILLNIDQVFHLERILKEKFAGQIVSVLAIENFVEQETIFLGTHMRQALKSMEQNKVIEVSPQKKDGKNRRKNSFPNEAIIKFT